MSEAKGRLWNGGTALALVTAALYCVSTAYYGGFMGVLRLDADVLDRNFHQTLYHGFLTAFVPAFQLLAIASVTLFASAVLATPAVNGFLRSNWPRMRVFLRLKKALLLDKAKTRIEVAQRKLAGQALCVLAVAMCVIYSLEHFDRLGQRAAEKLLTQLEGTLPDSTIVTVQIDGQSRRLLYLTCGARNCAGLDPVTHMVYYFPQNGHAFRHPKPLLSEASEVSHDLKVEPSAAVQASPNRSELARSQ